VKVSVIIPNWNGARLLGPCLDSLRQSTWKDFEVWVVDNGSEDASCALLRERYEWVRLIRLDRNYGFARACNEGIRAARGEWVVLLNNDMEVASDWLEELVRGMERHPDCALGASRILYFDDRTLVCNAGDRFYPWGAGGARGEGERDRGQFDTEEEVFGVCAGAAIYRRRLFDDIGGFDESFHSLAEDVDFNVRARLSGYRAVYLPRARVFHIGSATLGRYSDRYVYLAHRNQWFVLFKNLPLRLFWKHLGAILKFHVRTAVYFSGRGQGPLLLRAQWDALRRLPALLGRREAIQSRRRVEDRALEQLMDRTG